jgi:hypothetical protein
VSIFPRNILAVSFFLLTFATAYKTIVYLSGRASVIAYGFFAAGFFYAYKVSFSRQREKGLFNMAAA